MTLGSEAWQFAFGVAMIVTAPGYLHFGWLHVKLTLVAALIGYHIWCRAPDDGAAGWTQYSLAALVPPVSTKYPPCC